MLAATSVLSDLSAKCPPAEACRDAFDRMARATIKMCLSTTGFGSQWSFNKPQDDSTFTPPQYDRPILYPSSIAGKIMPSAPQGLGDWNESPHNDLLTSNDGSFSGPELEQWHTPSTLNSLVSMPPPTDTQYDPYGTSTIPSSSLDSNVQNNLVDYNLFDLDTFMANDNYTTTAPFTGDSGLNLGFDAHHNWADGSNAQLPDLFSGFFFGGSGEDGGESNSSATFPLDGGFGDGIGEMTGLWSGGQGVA